MKKIVSLLLVALFVFSAFCFTGCGKINDSKVAILWSGEGVATNPNSLINSFERAMYIEHVDYTHFGANGDKDKQLEQAKNAINDGCAVLAIELIETAYAAEIVALAKAKSIPVVFFNCNVDEEVVNSYDKCVLVAFDKNSVNDVQAELIADYVKANFKALDKNEDNKISYITELDFSVGMAIDPVSATKANEILATEDYKVKNASRDKINTTLVHNPELDMTEAELILTFDDYTAFVVLCALQEKDYNTDKLATQFVPIITVGEDFDYKAIVLANRPEIPADLVINDGDSKDEIKNKNKEIKKLEELQNYYYENRFIVDLRDVNESDLDEMIYTTRNVVDSGRIAGTVISDIDSMSLAVAAVVRNFIKDNDTFKGVASKVKDGETPIVTVNGSVVSVRYAAYSN